VVVQPQRLLNSPLGELLLKEEQITKQLDEMKKEAGVDLLQIERVVAFVEPPDERGEPPWGSLIRFAGGTDAKSILDQTWKNVKEGTCEGKTIYRESDSKRADVAYLPDSRTLVFADSEKILQKMLAAGDAESPLKERMQKADMDSDLVAVAVLEPVSGLIKQGVNQKGLPPMLAPFVNVPGQLKAATVTVDLSGSDLLNLVLEANDAENAEQVESVIKGSHQMLKSTFEAQRDTMTPEQKAEAGPMFDLADQALQGFSVARDGATLLLTLKKPESLEEMYPMLIQQAISQIGRGMMGTGQRVKEAPDLPEDFQF